MSTRPKLQRKGVSQAERQQRKRYFAATLVSCAVIAMIAGTAHVVKLGSNRMQDMQDRASYQISEMSAHIRAAGEDIILQDDHEYGQQQAVMYTPESITALLAAAQWQEVNQQILIPAGPFKMGTNRKRTASYDKPEHIVQLPAYLIDKYPVTNAQYARYIITAGAKAPLNWKNGEIPRGEALRPATMVSWYNARDYCQWAGKRLLTEAEWEKAARGENGRLWPWGNTMDSQRLNTYYKVGSTSDVTAYPEGASIYGVMDLAGNVSEWVADDFVPYPGTGADDEVFVAKVPVAKTAEDRRMKVVEFVAVAARYKVLRGGSWKSDPFSTSTYHRNYSWPQYASDFFGFRCGADRTIEPASQH